MAPERMLKALANGRRLRIAGLLAGKGEMCVTDIAAAIGLSFKATSRHLTILARADVLKVEQRGLSVFYRLAVPRPPLVAAALGD